jgi:tRNA dimethylallyltransferase
LIVALVGPTASGKSALAIEIAERLNGEVINADAMQIYRGLNIGTGKPTSAQRATVPHHVFDLWPVGHPVSVAEYQRVARVALEDVLGRGRTPIVVGGSWLYVRALLDELNFPGTDAQVRARWEQRLHSEGPAVLHAELARRDPAAAIAILPSNGRRIVRALEVIEITGEPFTANLPRESTRYPATYLGLDVPRDVLDERIADRVAEMWAAGWVDEVRDLPELASSPTAVMALGYPQVLAFVAGEINEQAARDETVRLTRKFARRQDRFFRRDERVQWLAYDAPDLLDQALSICT